MHPSCSTYPGSRGTSRPAHRRGRAPARRCAVGSWVLGNAAAHDELLARLDDPSRRAATLWALGFTGRSGAADDPEVALPPLEHDDLDAELVPSSDADPRVVARATCAARRFASLPRWTTAQLGRPGHCARAGAAASPSRARTRARAAQCCEHHRHARAVSDPARAVGRSRGPRVDRLAGRPGAGVVEPRPPEISP